MPVSKLERLNRELQSAIASGDLDLALAVTDDMVDIDPDSSKHHTSRGVVLAKLERTEEALEELDEALELDVDDERAWYSKGCVLMDSGRPRPALACFYKSLDLDPRQLKARDRFLKCLAMMQDLDPIEEEEASEEEPILYSREEETEPSEAEGPSWMDMIGSDEDVSQRSTETPVIERPPLPEEEPEFSRDDFGEGSMLDDDMFHEEEPEDEFEDWGEEDEEYDEEDEWEEDEEPVGVIQCRCGSDIPIYSQERPYRFQCPECGRTGSLR